MSRPQGWVLAVAVLSTGCFAINDLERYSFDDDPCPPVAGPCTGGNQYVYTQSAFDVTRPDEEGRLDGFDLDGTDRTVCRQDDHVSRSGAPGIDNQTTGLLISVEQFSGDSFPEGVRAAQLEGQLLSLYVLDNVDSFENDDCVSVQFAPGRAPAGAELPAYLDADGDGAIDPGVVFDFGVPTSGDTSACIVDGELRVRVSGEQTLLLAPGERAATVDRARMHCDVSEEALSSCVFAGSYLVDSLTDPNLVPVLQSAADLDFDGRRCRSVSFAMELEAVTAQLGLQRI